MVNFLKILIISFVQGITEWLPVSSTGHMILVDEFVKLSQSEAFWELFLIIVQFSSILAVVILFWSKLNPFRIYKKSDNQIKLIANIAFDRPIFVMWLKVLVASIPAAVIGLLFDDWLEAHLFNSVVVSLMLIIYGIGFIVVESQKAKPVSNDLDKISYKQALLLGGFQTLALIPGTSRSGATILGGLIMKIKRSVVAEFSFFMAIPVMFGASLLKIIKVGLNFSFTEYLLLGFGCLVAFLTSLLAIKFLMNYIKKNDFKIFGYYRIILGVLVLSYFLIFK